MRSFKSLDFDCTTVGFDQQVSVVLPLKAGTPTYWKLTASFGLKITKTGTFTPNGNDGKPGKDGQDGKDGKDGKPGQLEYEIYTFKVKRGYFIGFAHFGLFVDGNRRPIGAAHIRVKTVRFPEDETSHSTTTRTESETTDE